VPGWFNLPNSLTLLRVVLTAPVVCAIAARRGTLALGLFIAAGITDLLDGAAARRFGSATPVGAYLDPIADKLLLSSVFVALTWAGTIPGWFLALVLARDVLILAGALTILATTGLRKFPPSRLGKLSTFFQIGCAVMHMVRNAWPGPATDWLAGVSLWCSTGFTAASGVDYLLRGIRMVRRARTRPVDLC
jgi:cardiolipin synthase (CMP-forming)